MSQKESVLFFAKLPRVLFREMVTFFLTITSFKQYFCIQIFGSILQYLEEIFGLSAEPDIADS
jgi:hypothetical protein